MTIADIEFEMNINDVADKDISEIIEICKQSGFSRESLDEELQKRGYPKIFTVDYDDMDDENEDYDDDYNENYNEDYDDEWEE